MSKKHKLGKQRREAEITVVDEQIKKRFERVRPYVQHVLVCTDSKSKGCKKGGPAVLKAFQAAIKARGLQRHVIVSAISHIGGCKSGPNVIVYPDGVWYGLVEPEDVTEVVDRHLAGGELVTRLLRGSRVGGPCDGCTLVRPPTEPQLTAVPA